MKDEIVPIVDEKDRIIGYKRRDQLKKEEVSRSVALWIENSQGELLIAQRADSKLAFPGCWGSAASGAVTNKEKYEEAILRETEEEIGLMDIKPTILGKLRIDEGRINFFAQYFLLNTDVNERNLVLDKREVKAVKWIDKAALKKEVIAHPERFTPAFSESVRTFSK